MIGRDRTGAHLWCWSFAILFAISPLFAKADLTSSHVAPKNESDFLLLLPNLRVNILPSPSEMDGSNNKENLTIFEILMLSKLQNYVEDVMNSERFQDPFWTSSSFLTNLLDASQWSLRKAKQNYRKAIEFRVKNMQAMHEIPEQHLFDDFAVEIKGYDRDGCPVVILPVGEWRTYRSYAEKLKSIQQTNKNLKIYIANMMEQVLHKLRNSMRLLECSQITLIADMEGYSFIHNSGLRFFTDAIKDFEKSYPGILKIAYFINSPPDFLKVANSFKSIIPWDLRRRTFIFTNRAFWEYPINQNIDSSQLPMRLGGTNIFL